MPGHSPTWRQWDHPGGPGGEGAGSRCAPGEGQWQGQVAKAVLQQEESVRALHAAPVAGRGTVDLHLAQGGQQFPSDCDRDVQGARSPEGSRKGRPPPCLLL